MLPYQKRLILSGAVLWWNAESYMRALVVLKNILFVGKAFKCLVCLLINHFQCAQVLRQHIESFLISFIIAVSFALLNLRVMLAIPDKPLLGGFITLRLNFTLA